MTATLVRKLLRDIRLPLLVVCLLLLAFQLLWAKVTERITVEVLPKLTGRISLDFIKGLLFEGPGRIVQMLIGGQQLNFDQPADMLTIGYVHPLVITILCIWAVGRAAWGVAGEIDRGTMELLLAQPIARFRVILAHLFVDLLTIPLLCLSLFGGTWLGVWLFGHVDFAAPPDAAGMHVNPLRFAPALANVAGLLFAVSGCTMWMSAAGRSRGRVLGWAVLLTLLMFLVNLIGQLLPPMAFLRPLTVFYYFQPQQIILGGVWTQDLGGVWNGGRPLFVVNLVAVLAAVGTAGYGLALATFCRRDLPAPL